MISLKIIAAVFLLIIICLASLSLLTRQDPIKAASKRQLTPCPDKQNCVSSHATNKAHAITAFKLLDNNPSQSWQKLIDAILLSGGKVVANDSYYCHAVFTSTFFRFKDDVEIVLSNDKIDIRSASRVGRSDLGINRKRVEKIRSFYTQ